MTQRTRLSVLGLPQRLHTFSAKTVDVSFSYTGTGTITLTSSSDYDGKFNYTGTGTITITAPDTGVVVFTADMPYQVMASVFIDGEDYSSVLQGTVNVHREDNAAATFDITLKDITQKPSEFLNKVITIAFQAADEDAIVADYIPIFKGVIKRVGFNESVLGALNISGYDHGGVHGTPGELVSADITPVLSGSVYIPGPGTYSTGFAPIWNVAYTGSDEDDIKDGRDYFINTLTGKIVVPIASNFTLIPGGLTFSYAVPLPTLKDLMEDIAGRKGWSLVEDGVTIEDYTAITKQPVMSISDESVIDITRKFLELSGAKVETNLHPNMRVYSETVNITGADNHVIDETIYYEDSLEIDISADNLITEQTVRSVAKTFANIEIGSSRRLRSFAGRRSRGTPFTIVGTPSHAELEVITDMLAALDRKAIVVARIPRQNVNTVTFTAGGTTITTSPAYQVTIQDSDWEQTIDGDNIVFTLWMFPLIEYGYGNSTYLTYPGANWTLTINGTKVKYGEGTVEETVEVTGSRPVTGISDTLPGDVHEHPWAETAAHCGKCANSILTERGNIYNASCEVPLHLAKTMQIGDKINIERSSTAIFKGIIKTLNYSLNTETAESPVGIEAKGVGVGI